MVQCTFHAKVNNFVENFGSGVIRFGSIQISSPLSDESIAVVGSSMGVGVCLGHSVRVLGLWLCLVKSFLGERRAFWGISCLTLVEKLFGVFG